MLSWPRLLLIFITLGAVLFDPLAGGEARAQLGPNQQLPQPGVPTPTTDKPEGVAEQAEDGPDQLPTTPVLPQPKSERKRFELVELDGYYRFRTDWFKNFNLGFTSHGPGGAPFVQPLGCRQTETDVDGNVNVVGPCDDTLKSANMRLRLEPTINVTETARVYMTVDLLDNLVLGSTPASLLPGAESDVDTGDVASALRVRRVWAEVDTGLGQLSVGRQPWHWGLGIYANAGGADPFSGGYDLDSDFGDTVDRAMFRTGIPGTNLDGAIAVDWASTYPTATQADLVSGHQGQGWDLEDSDDINQWVFMLTRFDRPDVFAETTARGELALNYGAMLIYRSQDWATAPPADGEDFTDTLVPRGLTSYTPDAWLRLGFGKLQVELEGVATIGSIDNISDVELPGDGTDPDAPDATETVTESVDIRRFGAVGRVSYRAMNDALNLGLEVGFASGDRWDNVPAGTLHVRNARPLPVSAEDTTIGNFLFDFDYQVDLILFRELLGTVTNATYIKPSASYDFTDQIRFTGRSIISFANKKAATPGDSSMYGVELNGDLSYRQGPLSAGISYGVLFPMGALDRPAGLGFGDNSGDAGTAQTIQSRLVIRF